MIERSHCGYNHLNQIIATIDLGATKFSSFLIYIFFFYESIMIKKIWVMVVKGYLPYQGQVGSGDRLKGIFHLRGRLEMNHKGAQWWTPR